MSDITEEALNEAADRIGIPNYMRDGLIQYILNGRPTGHFLTAVFRNDLYEAVSRADEVNQILLSKYVIFLVNHAPAGCFGSPDRYKHWREVGGLEGLLHGKTETTEGSQSESI